MKHVIETENIFIFEDAEIVFQDKRFLFFNKAFDFVSTEEVFEKAESWSVRLQKMNPNSRWVTIRGRHVLIRLNRDKTATVIFSADPTMEHLKIVPKDHPEFQKILNERKEKKLKQIKAKKEKLKKQGKEAKEIDEVLEGKKSIEEYMDEERELAKKRQSLLTEKKKELKGRLIESVANEMGINLDKLGKRTKDAYIETANPLSDDLKDIEEEKQLHNVSKEVHEQLKTIAKTDKRKAKEIAEQFKEAVKLNALQQINNKKAMELTGHEATETIAPAFNSGVKGIDDAVNSLQMSDEQALRYLSHFAKFETELKSSREFLKKHEDKIKTGQKLDWSKLQLPENWENTENIILRGGKIKKVENKARAIMNAQFYNQIDMLSNDINKARTIQGVFETADVISDSFLGGNVLSTDAVELLGVANTCRLMANMIRKSGQEKVALNTLKNYMKERSVKVVNDALEGARASLQNAKNCDEYYDSGDMASGSHACLSGKFMGQAADHLATAAGSLSLVAGVIDALKDKKVKDIEFSSRKNRKEFKELMNKFGLKDDDYSVHSQSGKATYEVVIPIEKSKKMFGKPLVKRDEDLNKWITRLKTPKTKIDQQTGEVVIDKSKYNFHPRGMNKSAWDWETKEALDEKVKTDDAERTDGGGYKVGNKIFEPYINKKGENGYTSQYKEGTKLYRTFIPEVKLTPQQQRMAKFNLKLKKTILDGKPGIGKTVTIYSIAQDLKNHNKINFALYSPPSRLVNEAFKDAEKFFPNLRVTRIKSMASAEKTLREAAEGKWDVVLGGHDMIKDEKVAKSIAKYQPNYFASDEAHEVFGSTADSSNYSNRFLKTAAIAQNAEYCSFATGTPIRNSLKELCTMASILRPDVIPDADKFANHYGKLNQGTTIFQTEGVNKFRKDLNEVMITERNDLPIKVHTKEHSIPLSKEQQKRYGLIERLYVLEKQAKGFGLIDKKTGLPATFKEGKKMNLRLIGNNLPANFRNLIANGKKFKNGDEQALKSWMRKNGYNPNKYEIQPMGVDGATSRRNKRHYENIQAGDIKTNAKIQKALEIFRERKKKNLKVSFKYTNDVARQGMMQALLAEGVKESEILVLDSSVSETRKKEIIREYNKNPEKKYIFLSPVGLTGINLQRGDAAIWLDRTSTYSLQEQGDAREIRGGRPLYGNENWIDRLDTLTPFDQLKVSLVGKKENIGDAVGNPTESGDLRHSLRHIRKDSKTSKQTKRILSKYYDEIKTKTAA